MSVLTNVLISSFLVSLIALIGIILTPLKFDRLKKILIYFVSFSTGALLGGAFFHLLPEVVETQGFTFTISALIIGGIVLFFILEKIIHWHHDLVPFEREHAHPLAAMSLVGGGFHNLLDGLVIGASYLISVPVGIAITTAIVFHKIPKEMGWFGVLVHGGFSRSKALIYNYISSIFTIVGALLALAASNYVENIQLFIIPIAVGGFIYLAGSNLIPELHKEHGVSKSILQLITMLAGISVMILLLFLE
jgi:zinc and cadmium transporter